MIFSARGREINRTLARAHAAWRRGDLEEAERGFEAIAARTPVEPAALACLARVRAERGDLIRALATAAEASSRSPTNPVPRIFGALIQLDAGHVRAAREGVEGLEEDNVLAAAIEGLIDLRQVLEGTKSLHVVGTPTFTSSFPLAARWVPDAAGRVLALLETAFWRIDPAEAVNFHAPLFGCRAAEPTGSAGSEEAAGSAGSTGGPIGIPRTSKASSPPRDDAAWREAVDEAFAAGDHEEVERLHEAVPGGEDREAESTRIERAFSLLTLARPEKALRVAASARAGKRCPPDVHVVEGLCHARMGRTGPAGWCFARAARPLDIDVQEILTGVAERLGIRFDYSDR